MNAIGNVTPIGGDEGAAGSDGSSFRFARFLLHPLHHQNCSPDGDDEDDDDDNAGEGAAAGNGCGTRNWTARGMRSATMRDDDASADCGGDCGCCNCCGVVGGGDDDERASRLACRTQNRIDETSGVIVAISSSQRIHRNYCYYCC